MSNVPWSRRAQCLGTATRHLLTPAAYPNTDTSDGLKALPDLCQLCFPQRVSVVIHHVICVVFDALVPKLLFRVLAGTLPSSSICPLCSYSGHVHHLPCMSEFSLLTYIPVTLENAGQGLGVVAHAFRDSLVHMVDSRTARAT